MKGRALKIRGLYNPGFVMVLNTVYSFLPTNLQNKIVIRGVAAIAAITILSWGVWPAIQEYNNKIYAHVSVNGDIIKSKNFPWEITFSEKIEKKEIIYIINERFGDASQVSVKFDGDHPKYEKYIAMLGVAIKFSCNKEELSDFWICIKYP